MGNNMTQGKIIKNLILELFSDGKTHSTKEIRDYVTSHHINLSKNSTLIRNILFTMKNENNNFVNVGRGLYRLLNTPDKNDEDFVELVNAINIIETNINKCKTFNWYQCNDQQLSIARSKIQMIIKLSNTITSELPL